CAQIRAMHHAGVVHCSNLCTEITLNTSAAETAVCNLGSINLPRHVVNGAWDKPRLHATVATAMRMLDNVIDLNYYPTREAKYANLRHRPVGLGVMGLQDAFYLLNLNFDSPPAVEVSDAIMEDIAYHAILNSSVLAKERGSYQTFRGSKWDRGLLPLDTLDLLEQERGLPVEVPRTSQFDWQPVRASIAAHGMRNSNCLAIAPTATIANISGSLPSIEPIYKNIYVKSNFSGEFTVINDHLIAALKQRNLWTPQLLDLLKHYDGSVQAIEDIPAEIREKYKEVFEIDPLWIVRHAARRNKWLDQSQSVNIFTSSTSGRAVADVYFAAWQAGLKTTYYLRSLGASAIEKSTLDVTKQFDHTVQSTPATEPAAVAVVSAAVPATAPAAVPTRRIYVAEDAICEVCE
ncbi:MAG: ribonucleoside-diphosphate reductase subunit alpha, partial [Candidatus Andersenbacteria bacterium]|nr:ribonucleoside-diphosphate reductase subunit alpha [Candidatus Andersenbacteria bacterium]